MRILQEQIDALVVAQSALAEDNAALSQEVDRLHEDVAPLSAASAASAALNGGSQSIASNTYSVVSGGSSNTASGIDSAVGGGNLKPLMPQSVF